MQCPCYATRVGYKKVVEIRDMFTQTVRSLAGAVDAKDPFTAGHSERVQLIAKDLGAELRCSDAELEALEWGGLLHDIGKIGIPDAILLKTRCARQGRAHGHERASGQGRGDPAPGREARARAADHSPSPRMVQRLAATPTAWSVHEIPRLARIMHVADSYEAMTAARPYRLTPLTQEQALDELHKFSGIQFDPEVVAAFERLITQQSGVGQSRTSLSTWSSATSRLAKAWADR